MEITGGCLCGAVRYRVTGAPVWVRVCWCRLCQYIGAGSGTVNVCFAKEAVTITGELQKYSCVADSGNRMHRRFCPQCGTPMFSEGEQRSDLIFIRVGTLDDPEVIKPGATVWTAEAPAWACFDSSLPQFERARPPVA